MNEVQEIPPYVIQKQRCGLMIVDKMERVDELYEQFGFNGTCTIQIGKGTLYDRDVYRNENSENILVIVMDSEDCEKITMYSGLDQMRWIQALLPAIYEKWFIRLDQTPVRNMDIEFDIVAVGTDRFIYKHKHRSLDSKQVLVGKPYPNQKVD